MSVEKSAAAIEKLRKRNADLQLKIASNNVKIRGHIGRAAGVKAGSRVIAGGHTYVVDKIISEVLPKKGVPAITARKVKNKAGAVAARSEVLETWKLETPAPAAPKKRGRPPKVKAAAAAPAKRRGRPPKIRLDDTPPAGTA